MTPPTIGDKTPVETSSIRKFQPINPTKRNIQMFGKAPLETLLSRIGRKNIKQKIIKIPVLIIGTNKLETMRPRILFFFLRSLKTKPEIKPASVHFNKQARTVPTGLTGMNTAIVDGDNNAMMPLKKPIIAPEIGPHIAAANTTATREILILTGPNCK